MYASVVILVVQASALFPQPKCRPSSFTPSLRPTAHAGLLSINAQIQAGTGLHIAFAQTRSVGPRSGRRSVLRLDSGSGAPPKKPL